MTAVLICMGFNYAEALEDCLASIAGQDYPDLRAVIIDDASPDERCGKITREWCAEHGHTAILNETNVGTVRNAWNGIAAANPDPADVIVFIDADDRWSDPGCVSRIMAEYEDHPDCWLTYGSYRPEPYDPKCPAVLPYPADVIRERSFRGHPVLYNHPLSFKAFLWQQIDESDLQHEDGTWMRSCYDQVIMAPMLEIAAHNHRMISEVLYIYNTTHPTPDNAAAEQCERDYAALVAKPKRPRMYESDGGLCMDWRDRCVVIEDYLTEYGIRTVVETGTADGATAEVVAASTAVDRWWTVEADADRARIAAERLRPNPKIAVLTGTSPELLQDMVTSDFLADERVLWWLDAHLPIEDAGGDESRVTPIVAELAIVFGRQTSDLVLVDDARLFGTYPGYPSLEEVETLVGDLSAVWGVPYSMTVRHDIIRLVPSTSVS